jgi:hypothetical protein
VGNGDTNLTVKWNVHKEAVESHSPALTVSFAVEVPTGDASSQLGSGVADYGFNTVLEKTLTDKTTVRFNNGLILSGNTLTGATGLRAQGLVYTGGMSIARRFTEVLLLGGELNGALAEDSKLGKQALQSQAAGKYSIKRSLSLDLGLLFGRFVGSPRVGLQIGLSKDF